MDGTQWVYRAWHSFFVCSQNWKNPAPQVYPKKTQTVTQQQPRTEQRRNKIHSPLCFITNQPIPIDENRAETPKLMHREEIQADEVFP